MKYWGSWKKVKAEDRKKTLPTLGVFLNIQKFLPIQTLQHKTLHAGRQKRRFEELLRRKELYEARWPEKTPPTLVEFPNTATLNCPTLDNCKNQLERGQAGSPKNNCGDVATVSEYGRQTKTVKRWTVRKLNYVQRWT